MTAPEDAPTPTEFDAEAIVALALAGPTQEDTSAARHAAATVREVYANPGGRGTETTSSYINPDYRK